MSSVTREGLLAALLMGICVSSSIGASAEEAEQPPAEETPSEEGAPEDAPEEPPKEDVDEDVDGKEWITPDVGADEEDAEKREISDVDEVVIEYGASADTREDKVTDAEGKEIEEAEAPVVSKAVEVQDPERLEPGADKETGVQGQVVSRRPKNVLPCLPIQPG